MTQKPETELRRTIKRRDGISDEEFDDLVKEANESLADGLDPEEVLHDVFSIEPDYIFDLIKELERAS